MSETGPEFGRNPAKLTEKLPGVRLGKESTTRRASPLRPASCEGEEGGWLAARLVSSSCSVVLRGRTLSAILGLFSGVPVRMRAL